MSRYDLDLRPLDLELLWSVGRHVFKLCVKFEQNRTICCRVIDDLAIYFQGWGYFQTLLLRGGGPNSTKFGENRAPSSMHQL